MNNDSTLHHCYACNIYKHIVELHVNSHMCVGGFGPVEHVVSTLDHCMLVFTCWRGRVRVGMTLRSQRVMATLVSELMATKQE